MRRNSKQYKKETLFLDSIIAKIQEALFIEDLKKDSRERNHVIGRSIYYTVVKQGSLLSDVAVANYIKKEHGSSIHSRNNFKRYMRDYKPFEKLYDSICLELDIATEEQLERIINDNNKIALEDNLDTYKESLTEDHSKYNELIKLLLTVPEKHIETVKTRLAPIVKMLPA